MSELQIQAVGADAILPLYQEKGGYLVFANEDLTLEANQRGKISAGFKCAFSSQYCALMIRNGPLSVFSGLIDSDFRGELSVLVSADKDTSVKRGDLIARMLILKVALPTMVEEPVSLEHASDELR